MRDHHENSKQHISSEYTLPKFYNTNIVFTQSIEKYNENVKRNGYIMESIINAMCFLVQMNECA